MKIKKVFNNLIKDYSIRNKKGEEILGFGVIIFDEGFLLNLFSIEIRYKLNIWISFGFYKWNFYVHINSKDI